MKKQIRKVFKEGVFKRDKFTCCVCGEKKEEEELDAHHITDRNEMPNGGYVLSNGITVCKGSCHLMVERYHITKGEEHWGGLHPSDLYDLINSTREKAIEDSKKLEE